MKLRAGLSAIICMLAGVSIQAVEYDRFFADSTLRVDYAFAGDAGHTGIFLDAVSIDPSGWAGRRHHLDVMPLEGNGSIVMRTATDGTEIYRTTFSTLFSEWLSTPEAQTTPRSYENVYLLPFPRESVDILVTLTDSRRDTLATYTHRVDPADILISRPSVSATATPHRYIHRGGDSHDVIDVAILAEGYTVEEMDSFYMHATHAVESLFGHEPFSSMRDCFNFVAVASPSADSGVSVPRLGEWRDTAVGAHFSTFYSDRYLTTPHVGAIHDHLRGIPYEHIIILANTDEYGGGGIYNSYTLTTARNPRFAPVVVHEFGHSFGGLADEYFYDNDVMTDTYPTDIEPWEPNVTTTPRHPKWHSLLMDGTPIPTPTEDADRWPVGVYEGAAYSSRGVYRPADRCRMRDNDTPAFCPACQWALKNLIEFYTNPKSDCKWINN